MNEALSPCEVRLWGDFACFTRPEMKVERVSYPLMTPSAARGALEAIFWKPEFRWRIEEICVLRPIRYFSILRNEVNSRASAEVARNWAEHGGTYDPSEDRAQRHKSDHSMAQQEAQTIEGIEGQQHGGVLHDLQQACTRDRDKPDQRNRSEECSHFRGTARLHGKQRYKNQRRYRNDVGIERRRCELQSFDRRQHRQRRRDDCVAIEQGSADNTEQYQDRAAAHGAVGECHQCQRAALAVVIRAQQDHDIFERHHQDKRPDDQ